MNKIVLLCRDSETTVHDHTVKGWIATPPNVSKIVDELDITLTVADSKTMCVLDFLSNSTFRYTTYDGTLAAPLRLQSGYHLPGDVIVCDNSVIIKIIDNVMPILEKISGMALVIVPPLPRYIFNGCCDDNDHCTNMTVDGYQEKILDGLVRVRNCLIRELRIRGLVNFWVVDWTCVCGVASTKANQEILEKLKNVVATDGVHFKDEGYKLLRNSILDAWSVIRKKTVRGETMRATKTFYWRGFVSSNGSATHKEAATHSFKRRGARMHPYRRN